MRRDRVAQLDSALDFESSGCGFKSRRGCTFFYFLFRMYILQSFVAHMYL